MAENKKQLIDSFAGARDKMITPPDQHDKLVEVANRLINRHFNLPDDAHVSKVR